ncbi:aldo/keto reductase [Streptomyces sp. NPDC006967]|uniref:aldo/keto reductase n=1 Tax=Streptomyces sp. NPDC006967 TaxID=3156906 RepID=UPI0033DA533F
MVSVSRVPALVVGTMAGSGFFNGTMVVDRDAAEARAFVQKAVGLGFRIFDTAPVYGRGHAEQDLGKWLPADLEVWTKVGVDISGPLPRLDYSLDGMIASLSGSLERLGRSRVSVAMVHNPVPSVLTDLDLKGLADHCARTGQADQIGVSVLTPEASLPLLAPRLPAGSVVMCEADQMDPRDRELRAMCSDYRLVIRSIFSHGARLRGVPEARRAAVIQERIDELSAVYSPAALVIGPRLAEHLDDYRPAGTWPPEMARVD